MEQRQQLQEAATIPLAEGAKGKFRNTEEEPCRAETLASEEGGQCTWVPDL